MLYTPAAHTLTPRFSRASKDNAQQQYIFLCFCFFELTLTRNWQATHYIDSKAEDVAGALTALGGATIVLATAPNAEAAGACIDGEFLFFCILLVFCLVFFRPISSCPRRRKTINLLNSYYMNTFIFGVMERGSVV